MRISIIRPAISLFLIAAALYACQSQNEDKEKQEQAREAAVREEAGLKPGEVMLSQQQMDVMGIEFDSIEKRSLTDIVKANGYVLLPPQSKANVSTFLGGMVKTVNVIPGAYVRKGQVLATLESTDYIQLQEDYLKAENDLSYLEKDYRRQKEMLSAKATSEKMYQQTLNRYNSTKATVLSLQNKLKLLGISVNNLDNGQMAAAISVTSPINGYVQNVHVNVGKFADPTLVMFEIINNDRLFIDLQVYQEDLAKIKTGQKVLLSLPDQNGTIGEAVIYAMDKVLDNSTKSVNVHAKIVRNFQTRLFPGLYVNGSIQTGTDKVTALPSEAIYKEGGTENVFILSRIIKKGRDREYVFSAQEVKTGISNAGYTKITFLKNIPLDARIVVKGAYYIVSEKNKGEGGDQD